MFIKRFSAALLLTALPLSALAQDLTVLVAPRDTPAYDSATDMADDQTVFAERRLHRAFDRAAAHLSTCGDCTVSVRLAAGAYTGRGDTGMWTFPEVSAPNARLHISGGWNDAFDARAPFDTPTLLVATAQRSAPVLWFEGRATALAELVISGLVIDTSPSNNYDVESRSLMKGGTSTWVQVALGYMSVGHLVIADNVFMNAPEGVMGPQLRTPEGGMRMDIQNNIFFNSVTPWTIPGGTSDNKPEEIALVGNSFVLNWPRNPDPTTSNPGALEIGNNYATDHVRIESNLFAWNMGGAIFSQWDHDRSPPITIRDNLFWQNGLMYGATAPDDGVMVGKFNGAGVHSIYDAIDLEDDFYWDTADNVSFDPGFRLEVPDLKAVQYGSDYRGADVVVATADEAEDQSVSEAEAAAVDDLAAQLAALTGGGAPEEEEAGAAAEESAAEEEADDGVRILGPDNAIANYAPELPYHEVGIPMPTHPDAGPDGAYGASPDRIWRAN